MEGKKEKMRKEVFQTSPNEALPGLVGPSWELRVRRGHPTPTLFCLIVLTLRLPVRGVFSWTTTL